MNWRIFVNIVEGSKLRYRGSTNVGDLTVRTLSLHQEYRSGEQPLKLTTRGGIGEFFESEGWHRPALPPMYAADLVVTRVTGVGAPPAQNVVPGLYEVRNGEAVATGDVRKNGEKLKIEIDAPSLELAYEVYRAVLSSNEAARIATY